MKQPVDIWDMTVATDDQGKLRIFNLSRDGKMRIFDGSSSTPSILFCVDLVQLIPKWSHQITNVALKSVPVEKGRAEMLLIHLVTSGSSHVGGWICRFQKMKKKVDFSSFFLTSIKTGCLFSSQQRCKM
jgi:hypothetical protein